MRTSLLSGILCLIPLLLCAQYERLGKVAAKVTDIQSIDDTYYGACYKGIYKSENQGQNWEFVSQFRTSNSTGITSFFIHDTIMYVAENAGNIVRSTDRGITFTPVSPVLSYTDRSAFIQKNDSVLYFHNGSRFYVSMDNGLSFDQIWTGGLVGCTYTADYGYMLEKDNFNVRIHRSTDHFVTSEIISAPSPVSNDALLFTEYKGTLVFSVEYNPEIYISTDEGNSWQVREYIPAPNFFNRTEQFIQLDDTLFAATRRGLLKTTDSLLLDWEYVKFPTDDHYDGAPSISNVSKVDSVLFATLENNVTYRRYPNGEWKELRNGLEARSIKEFTTLDEELLFVKDGYRRHRYSRDGGYTFDLYQSPILKNFFQPTDFVNIRKFGAATFAWESLSPLYRSLEGDTSITEVLPICDIIVSHNDTLWALNDENKLLLSTDQGDNWLVRSDLSSFVEDTNYPDYIGIYKDGQHMIIFVVLGLDSGHILHSNDNGLTFTSTWTERTFFFSAEGPHLIAYGSYDEEWLIVSDDYGATWQSRPIIGALDPLWDVILRDSVIMAHDRDELYFSTNFGQSWNIYPPNDDQIGPNGFRMGYFRGDWLLSPIGVDYIFRLDLSLLDCIYSGGEGECALLNGRVYQDTNGNCQPDSTEQRLHPYLIRIDPGGYLISTDDDGYYRVGLPAGNYTISPAIPAINYWQIDCPEEGAYNVTIEADTPYPDTLDFAVRQIPGIQDLRVNLIQIGDTRINEPTYFALQCQNIGTVPTPVDVSFRFPNTLTLTESSIPPSVNTETQLEWSVEELQEGDIFAVGLYFLIDNNTDLIGQTFSVALEAEPMNNDTTPSNNIDTLELVYNGAYDPNDKQAEPRGQGPDGNVLPTDTVFTYTIRFQNTGNAIARRVRLLDTLSTVFDPASFQMVAASHDYRFRLLGNHILEWDFVDVNLPDSTSNEAESHGFVTFNIKLAETLPLGATIRNRAAIYFDSNPPIFTNRTLNTVNDIIQTGALSAGLPTIEVFPNPTRGQFQLRLPETLRAGTKDLSLTVFTLDGRAVYTQSVTPLPEQLVRLPQLAKGPYVLQLRGDHGLAAGGALLIIQ